MPESKNTFLDEAAEIVNGDRNKFYGHPLDNHGCTADMWSAYLSRRFGVSVLVTPEDVCVLNILQKTSREANMPKRDNLVDIIGYSLNVEMIEDERARRFRAMSSLNGEAHVSDITGTEATGPAGASATGTADQADAPSPIRDPASLA